MKPVSEASGVRSSWLALATKSTRMRSVRRRSLRSSRMSTMNSPPGRRGARRDRRTRRRTSARSGRARRTRPAPAGRRCATRSKAATRSGIAQAEGQRLAGADREGRDGALVGVADDAAPVENEAGIGQCVGEGLHAAFRADRRRRTATRRQARSAARARGSTATSDQQRQETATPAGSGATMLGQDEGEQQQADRGDQPAAFRQPGRRSRPRRLVRGPALRTGGNHPRRSRSGGPAPRRPRQSSSESRPWRPADCAGI